MFEFKVNNLPPYILGEIGQKILSARQEGRDIVDLSQVNPELSPPPMAIDYLVGEVLREHNHRYSASRGISRLREAACQLYNERFGLELDSETEVIATMGTKEAMSSLLTATLSPGETVLLPDPCYPTYQAQAFFAGAKTASIPLLDEVADSNAPLTMDSNGAGFIERLDKEFQATWPRPKVLIINFPNNPTTTSASLEFFEKLVGFARENSILIINDFSYLGLDFGSEPSPSLLQVPGAKDCSVELFSLSKGFNLPGWRVGFALGNKEAISALSRIKSYSDFGIFQPLQIAASRLLENYKDIFQATTNEYQKRRDVFIESLREQGWLVPEPESGLFLWAKIPDKYSEIGSLKMAEKLLDEHSVASCPGAGFGSNGEGFIRFSLVEKPERLKLACERLSKGL